MRSPPKRPDGKEWTKNHRRAAQAVMRGIDLCEVAEELLLKTKTVRDWEKIEGFDELVEWERAEAVRADLEQLGSKALPVLDRLLTLADASLYTRRFLDDALREKAVEPGEFALRVAQLIKVEREAVRDYLNLSGFAELRASAARKLAVMPTPGAAPENMGNAPEPLTPEEERERALQTAKVLAELGGKVEVG